jgi:glucokinase
VIVIGGRLAAAGDVLLDPVRTQLATGLPWRAAPPVELGVLGPVAARRGAELLAWSLVPLR